ncbi:winged helix DNA-binding domain-containing protein [Saccharothrix luteola]|uniref:winged helix DNA-binding domain-containing protein n=1 Tax=Saccharothrix luteola TaxID=2893018 RepID=UPI001E29AA3C|nr:winged helix DNA-binding domain-containing protein [Saccharothrix luteola]MCC8248345.1 winged helix DNA-binding domain-containing protein [Saccharothrix luteola]
MNRVIGRRLRRHSLLARSADPAAVVRAMCGAHAQVMSAAEMSIGVRTTLTRQQVRDALWVDRTVVKTRGPRGTVHLLPAADLPMWTGALAQLPQRLQLLTEQQTAEVVAAIADALRDDELTGDELTEAVVARTGAWAGDRVMEAFGGTPWPRWVEAMGVASNLGAMCFAPNKGRKTAYTSPQRWLPGFAPAADGAVALLHAYLRSYGPATQAHFAKWLAAPKRWVDAVFERADLEQVDGGWVVRGDTSWPEEPPAGVRLLPYFDAYVVGSHPREVVFPGRAAERALWGGQAGNFPVLLVDGVVAGVWHQKRSGRRIVVTVEPFAPLSRAHAAELDREVAWVGEFLEGRPELTVGTVSVGGHA